MHSYLNISGDKSAEIIRSYMTINMVLGKNHSIDKCLPFWNEKILKGFDDGLLTGMILIELQKSFGTSNHDILTN